LEVAAEPQDKGADKVRVKPKGEDAEEAEVVKDAGKEAEEMKKAEGDVQEGHHSLQEADRPFT